LEKIDTVLLTKNSVFPCLRECLVSVKQNVPVNRFIVVDGGSTDETLKVVEEIFPEAQIIYDLKGNRATARQIGIKNVETEWFFFIDSDVVLHSNWYGEAAKCVNAKVGAVQGATVQRVQPIYEDFQYSMRRIRKMFGGLTYKPFLEPVHRGFTGDIILRTKLVKDIEIPKFLHIFEDHYLKRWIEDKGFEWLRSEKACCDHYYHPGKPKVSYEGGYIGWVIGYISLKRTMVACVTIFPKLLLALCFRPNIKMAWWELRFQFWKLVGLLRACLREKKRLDIKKKLDFTFGARKEEIDVSPDYIQEI